MDQLDKIKVLIVDDEVDLVEILSENLKLLGASVHTANSVDAAVIVCQKEMFDFVISDFKMPRRNGLEFLQYFRNIYPEKPPFFFLTGFASNIEESELISQGANGVISKPYNINKLVELIHQSVKK